MNILTFRRRPMHTPSRQFGSDFLRTVGRFLMASVALIFGFLSAIGLLVLLAAVTHSPWLRIAG